MKHILICGKRNSGKTELLDRLLEDCRMPLYGFRSCITATREDGFHEIHMFPIRDAERRPTDENRIGICNRSQREVNLQVFETLGVRLLEAKADGILVMDELGFMEAEAEAFCEAVLRCLDGDIPVNVPAGYKGPAPDAKSAAWLTEMLELAAFMKRSGIWEENGSVTPQPGWIIVYNWDDATQPNDGYSDHIGIVEKVSGGYITCIEGNMNGGVVGRRTIPVGWGYIRGFAKPKYATSSGKTEEKQEQTATQQQAGGGTTLSKAKKWNGIVVDKTGANVRTWPGTENHQVSFSPLKYGTVVDVCDTIKAADQTDWYYIRYNGRYGFVSAALIQRKETAAAAPFTPKEQATKKTATCGASIGPDKSVAGTYKVTADSLNIRNRAGVDTAKGCTILGAIPEGTKVQNYGFYSMVGGVKWLYIQVTYDGVTYTGHCSGEYLKKV